MNDEAYFFLKMTTRVVIGVVLCLWAVSSCCMYQNKVFLDGGYIECPARGSQSVTWVKTWEQCK